MWHPKAHLQKVRDCKIVNDGVRSDHSALRMTVGKLSVDKKVIIIISGRTNYYKLQYYPQTSAEYKKSRFSARVANKSRALNTMVHSRSARNFIIKLYWSDTLIKVHR